MSMPRVGSSRMSSFGCRASQRAEHHLLLVAARQLDDLLVEVGRLDRHLARRAARRRRAPCGGRTKPKRRILLGHAQSVTLSRIAAKQQQRLVLAVLRREADAGGDRVGGLSGATAAPFTATRRRRAAVIADDRRGELGAPGAHQAADADDLAAHRSRLTSLTLAVVSPSHVEQRRRPARAVAMVEQIADVAADHQLGDRASLGSRRRRRAVDQPPSRSTAMRSASSMISFSRCEM